MAGGGKKKTTMAKLQRENRRLEKRREKEHRKQARNSGLTPANAPETDEAEPAEDAWQLTRGLDRGLEG
jgi:hypothetical protein